MQRAWLDFVTSRPAQEWPAYEVARRATRIIRSARDLVVDDPDRRRREAWIGLY
jgi:para-nitrobenzyl esterase